MHWGGSWMSKATVAEAEAALEAEAASEAEAWWRGEQRRQQQLHGELGVKGQVQLERRRRQEDRGLVGGTVACLPGEEDGDQPLWRLRRKF